MYSLQSTDHRLQSTSMYLTVSENYINYNEISFITDIPVELKYLSDGYPYSDGIQMDIHKLKEVIITIYMQLIFITTL